MPLRLPGAPPGELVQYTPKYLGNDALPNAFRLTLKVPTEADRRQLLKDGKDEGAIAVLAVRRFVVRVEGLEDQAGKLIETGEQLAAVAPWTLCDEIFTEITRAMGLLEAELKNFGGPSDSQSSATPASPGTVESAARAAPLGSATASIPATTPASSTSSSA
jgi:hypothetical protein